MVIRMRHNRSQTRQRRSHHGLKAPMLSACKNCGELHRPHHMCLSCGFYNGRQVLDLVGEKAKRETRMQAKREAISASAEVPATPHTHTHPDVPVEEAKETAHGARKNPDRKPSASASRTDGA